MASPATAVRCGRAAELRPAPDPGPTEPVAPLPCLHCGAAGIDPAAACPRCRHPRPRHHGAGISHLDLLAVEDPEQLRAALLRRWPQLDALQQHSFDRAARSLSWGPRRLLSFVARDEAAALRDDLARHGVRCRLHDEPSWPWGLIALFSLSLVVFTSLRYGPGLYLLAYLLYFFSEPLVSLARARQSLLGASRLPRGLWPSLQLRSALLTGILVCIEGSQVARGIDQLSFAGAFHLLLATLAGIAALASLARLGPGLAQQSPEPSWPAQLSCLLHARNAWLRSESTPVPRRRRRPPSRALQAVAGLTFAAVLIAETALLQGQGNTIASDAAGAATEGPSTVSSALASSEPRIAPAHAAQAPVRRWLPVLLPLLAVLLLAGLARRVLALRSSAAFGRPSAAGRGSDSGVAQRDARGPCSLVIVAIHDPPGASSWLVERLGPRCSGSPAQLLRRLEREPAVLLRGISAALAAALVEEASTQGMKLRAVWGEPAVDRRRLDELDARTLGAGALAHLALVGALGWLGLVMGARLEQLLLLPVGVGLVLLPLLRRRSRRPLLRLRPPGAGARRSAGRGSSSRRPRAAP